MCNSCGAIDVSLCPGDFNEGIAAGKDGERTVVETPRAEIPVTNDGRPRPAASHPATRPAAAQAVAAPRPAAYAMTTTADVVACLRARRDVLAMKVAEGDAAKVEIRKLNKILSAAERAEAAASIQSDITMSMSMEH